MQKAIKYKDELENVYGVERASNGNYVVMRTNSGGNRKCCKSYGSAFSPDAVQRTLDLIAYEHGWKVVAS